MCAWPGAGTARGVGSDADRWRRARGTGLGITVFAAAFLLAGAEPEVLITAVIVSGRHRPGLAAWDAICANLTRLTDSAIGLTQLAFATTAELFALAWAAMRRRVSEIAVAGVIGSVAYNATAALGVAALVRPLTVSGILAPAIAATVLPVALLVVTRGGRLTRWAGALLVISYAGWVTAVLAR